MGLYDDLIPAPTRWTNENPGVSPLRPQPGDRMSREEMAPLNSRQGLHDPGRVGVDIPEGMKDPAEIAAYLGHPGVQPDMSVVRSVGMGRQPAPQPNLAHEQQPGMQQASVSYDDLIPQPTVSYDDLIPKKEKKGIVDSVKDYIKNPSLPSIGGVSLINTPTGLITDYAKKNLDLEKLKDNPGDIYKAPISGLVQGGNLAVSGAVDLPVAVMMGYMGKTEQADARFSAGTERAKKIKGALSELGLQPSDAKYAEVIEGVAKLPYFMANRVLSTATVSGNFLDTSNSLTSQGVDTNTALYVAGLQTMGDAALSSIPLQKLGANSATMAAAKGPGAGGLANYLSYLILEQKGYTKAAEGFKPTDPANWIPDTVGAAVGHAGSKAREAALTGDNVIKDKALKLLEARQQIRDSEAAQKAIDEQIPVAPQLGISGDTAAMHAIDQQPLVAPQLGLPRTPESPQITPEPVRDATQPEPTQMAPEAPVAPTVAKEPNYNPEIFSEGYEKTYPQTREGFTVSLRSNGDEITGTKEATVEVKNDKGEVVSTAEVNVNREGNLEVNQVVNAPGYEKGHNLGDLIYRTLSTDGAIDRSGQGPTGTGTSPAGTGMWGGFQKTGLSTDGKTIPWNKGVAGAETNDGRTVLLPAPPGHTNVNQVDSSMTTVAAKVAAAVKKTTDSTSPLAIPDQQKAAMEKIPGMDLGEHVSKDTPVDVVIAKLIEWGKDMKPHWDWIGGSELTSWIKDNPMVYAMAQWWGNGHDRHNLNEKALILPLEHKISDLVRSGKAYDVMAVRHAEMYAEQRLSEQDLRDIGMTPEQIDVHQGMTRLMDAQLARTNAILKAQGRDEITAQEAYSSAQRRGNWKTPVYDKKGKVVGFVQETSKARAKYALARIALAHPDVDISKSKPMMDRTGGDGSSRFAGMDNLAVLSKILGSDHPLVKEIQATQEQDIKERGTNVMGYNKHMLPSAKVRYALGEQPWKTDQENVRDYFDSQIGYLREASLWSELQTAAENTKLVLNDARLKAEQPMVLQWAQDKMNAELGYGARQGVRKMERVLSENLGELADVFSRVFPPLAHMPTDMRSINQGVGVGKAMFYIQKLGFFNGKFMGISLMQPAYAMAHHRRLTNEGYDHNPLQTLGDAQYMSSVALTGFWGDTLGLKVTDKIAGNMDRLTARAIKYMEANGVAGFNQMSEVGHLDRSPTMRFAIDAAQFSITQPERVARTEVFMTFVSHLHQSGKFKGREHEMFQKAEETTNLVMGNYAHNERAMAFNKLGSLGGGLNALKTYPLNMAGQTYGFIKDGKAGKGWSPLMAQLGTGLVLAGGMGIAGREYIEGLWDWYLEGYVAAGGNNPKIINFNPIKVLMEVGDDLGAFGLFSESTNNKIGKTLQYGVPSVVTGRDLSGSLGNQGPEPTVEGMLPWLSDFAKQSSKVFSALTSPDTRSLDRAIHAVSPSSVQGNLEMKLPTMTDPRNPALQLPVNHPERPGIERTPAMIAAKTTPFVPTSTLEESDARRSIYKNAQQEKFLSTAKETVSSKFKAAIAQEHSETELKRLLIRYEELGGSADSLVKQINKSETDRAMSLIQRLGQDTKTDVGAKRYLRFKEAWDRRLKEDR